jgi:hypothetical protein
MLSWFPFIAFAQSTTPGSVTLLIYKISYYILNPLIKLGFIVALAYFFWSIIAYIRDRNAGHIWDSSVFDEKGKRTTQGADNIMYGLLGLFIMSSAFAILALIKNILGLNFPTPF